MRNITGSVTFGDDFFDRQSEIARFWRDLETDSLLLLAPRRVGKTSILRRLQEQAGEHGFQAAIFRDVSDCKDELAFVKHLSEAILESDRATAFQEEAWAQELVGHSFDSQEGVRSFVERRPTEFKGW